MVKDLRVIFSGFNILLNFFIYPFLAVHYFVQSNPDSFFLQILENEVKAHHFFCVFYLLLFFCHLLCFVSKEIETLPQVKLKYH